MPGRFDPKQLPRQKIDEILDFIDQREDPSWAEKRKEPWSPYRISPLKLEIIEPGGTTRTMHGISRNLSGGGMSIVLNGYLHVGTECKIELTTIENAWYTVQGMVRRCEHVGGQIHEIGVQFIEPVDTARFVPIKVAANILIVEDNPAISRMTSFILQKAEATTRVVESGEDAVKCISDSLFDLILMDVNLPGMSGLDATREIRNRGLATPIIAFTANESDAAREECLEAGCTDFLPKPVQRNDLLQKILALLNEAPPVTSSLANDPEMEELVVSFVESMPAILATCREALQNEDHEALYRVIRDLKASSGSHGFDVIADSARQAEALLVAIRDGKATSDLSEAELTDGDLDPEVVKTKLHGTISNVLSLCSRARTG